MIDSNPYSVNNLLLALILVLFIVVFTLISRLKRVHNDLVNMIKENPEELKKKASHLREIDERLKRQKYGLVGKEEQQVLEEMTKISHLWKSRRESLRKGFWERMEGESDEIKKLQDEKGRLEELIKNTKAKYHRREIDEESFREIVKDYQKELMEINVKIGKMRGREPT